MFDSTNAIYTEADAERAEGLLRMARDKRLTYRRTG